MATRAYNEIYLGCAQENLATMFRYGTENCSMQINEFHELFLQSGIARMFGHGDFRYLSGMSGIELAFEVLRLTRNWMTHPDPVFHLEKSPGYWTGWILAFYQWYSGLTFERIHENLKPDEILKMYHPFHEMDPLQFADHADELIVKRSRVTRLKMYRDRLQMSQNELAAASGCSVRMIQNYEQRRKNINKAQLETILSLTSVLHCSPEDLMEYLPDKTVGTVPGVL